MTDFEYILSSGPHIIYEKEKRVEDLISERFVRISLSKCDKRITPFFFDNNVAKAIMEKYPETKDFFEKTSFNGVKDLNTPTYPTFLYEEFLEEMGSMHIIIDKYESLEKDMQVFVNTMIRIGCKTGIKKKVFFHIISKVKYKDFPKGTFNTLCDQEKILMNHEIQEIEI